MTYTVQTRDTDGGTKRDYKSLDKAIVRFETMVGYSVASAIQEAFHECDPLPTIHAVKHIRAVSTFGTVVEFTRNGKTEAEPIAVPASPARPDDYESLEKLAEELNEGIDAIRESAAERMAQYNSECAAFGDAGPGQHPSCWGPRSDEVLTEARAELAAVIAKMEALRPTPPAAALAEAARLAELPDDIPF